MTTKTLEQLTSRVRKCRTERRQRIKKLLVKPELSEAEADQLSADLEVEGLLDEAVVRALIDAQQSHREAAKRIPKLEKLAATGPAVSAKMTAREDQHEADKKNLNDAYEVDMSKIRQQISEINAANQEARALKRRQADIEASFPALFSDDDGSAPWIVQGGTDHLPIDDPLRQKLMASGLATVPVDEDGNAVA